MSEDKKDYILGKYQIMLQALHGRESQVFQMFAYVAPTLAALGWLVSREKPTILLITSFGLLLSSFLSIGKYHLVTMAYNFRMVVLQCGKLEKKGKFSDVILNAWAKRKKEMPEELLPEMFKPQNCILEISKWVVLGACSIMVISIKEEIQCITIIVAVFIGLVLLKFNKYKERKLYDALGNIYSLENGENEHSSKQGLKNRVIRVKA